jgi:CubicO group peptidase (beta-lactamase class C family)
MKEKLQVLKKKMEEGVYNGVFPGATYAVIIDGKTYTDYVGYRDLYPKKEKNTIDTLYDLASLTKVIVTTILIAQLIDEKKLTLNNRVCDYFQDFKHKDITIYDLLTHSSGLPANIDWMQITTKDDYIKLLFETEKIYETKSKSVYSDVGFIILGLIIEKILNQPLDVIATNKIFNVLGMKETMYNPIDKNRCAATEKENDFYLKGIAHGKKTLLFDGMTGHAGLFSTISDMVKIAGMLLNDGKYLNKRVLSPNVFDSLFIPRIKDTNGFLRGLGFISGKNELVGSYVSEKTIYHTGFTGTRFLVDYGNKISFIILSNRIHPTRKNDKLKEFRKEVTDMVYELFIVGETIK